MNSDQERVMAAREFLEDNPAGLLIALNVVISVILGIFIGALFIVTDLSRNMFVPWLTVPIYWVITPLLALANAYIAVPLMLKTSEWKIRVQAYMLIGFIVIELNCCLLLAVASSN